MKKQTAQLFLSVSLVLCAVSTHALATLVINVGDHTLLPNTPNQEIQIFVTSDAGDLVHGMNLQAGIGDGRNQDGDSNNEPIFQGIEFTGSIWGDTSQWTQTGAGFPPIFSRSMGVSILTLNQTNASVSVSTNSLIATFTIDTTNIPSFDSGTWPLYLSTSEDTTTFSEASGGTLTPTINNGSITIAAAVPEPSPALFGLVGFAGFGAILFVRRARKLVPIRSRVA